MAHSIFDLFKVGIALFKSHIVTLMVAAHRFIERLIIPSAISVASNAQLSFDISLASITKRHSANIFDSSAQVADRNTPNEILTLVKNIETTINSPICSHGNSAVIC